MTLASVWNSIYMYAVEIDLELLSSVDNICEQSGTKPFDTLIVS